MQDVLAVAVVVGFFVLAALLLNACSRIVGSGEEEATNER